MAIQVRRGLLQDFDPVKMLPGEWAVSIDPETDKQVVWMCFSAGVVKRMGTYEDFVQQVTDATADVKDDYMAEFNIVLDSIRDDVASVADNKDIVLQIKADITDIYLPQITEAYSNAVDAANSATESFNSATLATSYAVGGTGTRENEDVDNAMYYKEQAERISQGLSGTLLPMGTVTFAQLASQTKQAGYMFNISNAFITDATFKEGAGYLYPEGTNVYYTVDGFWDCLAGRNVTDDFEVDITKIEGATIVTPTNPDLDISLDNVATITSAKDFDVVACGKNLIDVKEGTETATSNVMHDCYTGGINSLTVTMSQTAKDLTSGKVAQHWYKLFDVSGNLLKQGKVCSFSFADTGETKVATSIIDTSNSHRLELYINAYHGANSPTLITNYVQIELGTQATPYEPYKSNKLTITKELNKLPNGVADTRERLDDKYVKYTHRIGKTTRTTTGSIVDAKTNGQYICSVAPSGFLNGTTFTMPSGAASAEILYELAEPIVTIVEEPSTLTSYNGVINVFTTAMAQPKLTVDFKSILKSTVDDVLSLESENPVQNKVVKTALDEINSDLTTYSEITTGSGERGELYEIGDFTVKKQFNHAVVSCTLFKSTGSTIVAYEVLYTISVGYRPASDLHLPCLFRNTNSGGIELGYVAISTGGVVSALSNPLSTGMNQVVFSISYIAA